MKIGKIKAWSIGRENANQADILIANETVSKVHATLNLLGNNYYIADNNSTNGTFIQRHQNLIKITDFTLIETSDVIYFGEFQCSFYDLVNASEKNPYTLSDSDEFIRLFGKSSQEPSSSPELDMGKRVRCLDCREIVYSNQQCPVCGSTKHMEVN